MSTKVLAVLLVAVLAVSGCRTAPINNVNASYPTASSSPRALTQNDYKRAIIRAGANRGWTFDDAGPGHLIGRVDVRGKHSAVVDLYFDRSTYRIEHQSSQGLNYDASKNAIHPNYNKWVQNLQRDIDREVIRAQTS